MALAHQKQTYHQEICSFLRCPCSLVFSFCQVLWLHAYSHHALHWPGLHLRDPGSHRTWRSASGEAAEELEEGLVLGGRTQWSEAENKGKAQSWQRCCYFFLVWKPLCFCFRCFFLACWTTCGGCHIDLLGHDESRSSSDLPPRGAIWTPSRWSAEVSNSLAHLKGLCHSTEMAIQPMVQAFFLSEENAQKTPLGLQRALFFKDFYGAKTFFSKDFRSSSNMFWCS